MSQTTVNSIFWIANVLVWRRKSIYVCKRRPRNCLGAFTEYGEVVISSRGPISLETHTRCLNSAHCYFHQ